MYKKSVQGWLKHLDFMILDVVCLWISFTLAFGMRHGSLNVFANSLYRDMMWSLALMDIVVIFFFDSLKNVLKRGFYREFTMTVKQTCLITLCSVFYLFTFKEADNYSRLVLTYTAALYLLLSYITRNIWKHVLRKYLGENGRRSLLIVTVSEIVDTVIDNIKNKNYSDYIVTGVCILDDKAKGRTIDGVPVVADKEDLVEYVCREWVDEVFLNIPESESYPSDLLDKFIEMGVVVHMKLAKSQNLLGKKQFVERLGTYTVLTTSINSVSRRQIVLKRMLDILGGLAGCIITGILCIFVGPAIYIQSPGPIFFKQTRVGKNGKLFQMYKFRSMYMDAEERKAELMKENRVQDGMMFKLDFDPRIIGSKKLPDGTIKKGVGNFIRDWSLDEFPQFLNVLKGDMSIIGTRPPLISETNLYELHHLLIYKKTLVDAHQMNYITVMYHNGFLVLQDILQIMVLFLTRNFILFLVIAVVCTIIGNICMSRKADRLFPYLKEPCKEQLPQEERHDILRNVKAMLMHKIGNVVVNNTDNLLISSFVGIISAGIYSNYYLIIGSVRQVLEQAMLGVAASVGNLGVTEENEKIGRIFDSLFFIGYWLFGFAGVCLLELLNPFVKLAFGKKYLFPKEIVLILCMEYYSFILFEKWLYMDSLDNISEANKIYYEIKAIADELSKDYADNQVTQMLSMGIVRKL